MAITMESIKTLRAMTGAGLADVKKALTEADGDMDRAKEILRERGQAIAAKRSDRETSNGCVLVKSANGFSAIIALKCETDFVANGADYIKLTQEILDNILAKKGGCEDKTDCGIIIQGSDLIFTKIMIAWENPSEITLWEGSQECGKGRQTYERGAHGSAGHDRERNG